ncbi:MAG: hypothetical protein AAGG44_18965, partial [Planctomycetota bacterium]
MSVADSEQAKKASKQRPSSNLQPLPKQSQTLAQPIAGTHLPAFAFQTGNDLAKHAAQTIARLIRERSDVGQTTV